MSAGSSGSIIGLTYWNGEHEELGETVGFSQCRVCHGTDGLGTVLSRAAADRYLECKEVESGVTDPEDGCANVPGAGKRIVVAQGEAIGCDLCHENKIDE